jgi:hypothetical protein
MSAAENRKAPRTHLTIRPDEEIANELEPLAVVFRTIHSKIDLLA